MRKMLIQITLMVIFIFLFSSCGEKEEVCPFELSGNEMIYEYSSNNILGLKRIFVEGDTLIYEFKKNKLFFSKDEIDIALENYKNGEDLVGFSSETDTRYIPYSYDVLETTSNIYFKMNYDEYSNVDRFIIVVNNVSISISNYTAPICDYLYHGEYRERQSYDCEKNRWNKKEVSKNKNSKMSDLN